MDELKELSTLPNQVCYSLQGWFGRNATRLIERGLISEDGTIDWDLMEELK